MTQDGDDRELVLGNKQLISLFFVVVALCGVFFAMGYMIGRNSGKTTLTGDGSPLTSQPLAGNDTSVRQQPEPPRETAQASPESAPPSVAETSAAAPIETKPAQDTPVNPPDAKSVPAPETGVSYLQVTALPRADADNVVKTLRDQNFPAILASSSKDGLFRVLVGPYRQTADLADAKTRLKTIGFGSAFVQKQ